MSHTLLLLGSLPRETLIQSTCDFVEDRRKTSLHVVAHDFGEDVNDPITLLLSEIYHFGSRSWNSVKLSQCSGKNLERIIEAVMVSRTRRLILSALAEENRAMKALGQALSTNKSLLTLGLHDMTFDQMSVALVADGLKSQGSLMELSFTNSRFSRNDFSIQKLASGLRKTRDLQLLSFSDCRLSDEQCHDLVKEGLVGRDSLVELSLDGNHCHRRGLDAISLLLEQSNLLVLDLSSQKNDNANSEESMELWRLANGLMTSRLRCLQLSGNIFSNGSIQKFSRALVHNCSIRVLHLAWCSLDETSIPSLAEAMVANSSLSKVVLYESGLRNDDLIFWGEKLSLMKGLRQLDIGGHQHFDKLGLSALQRGLQNNFTLEEVSMDTDDDTRPITFLCDVNRARRRVLHLSASIPSGLWHFLLAKVYNVETPKMSDNIATLCQDVKSKELDEKARRLSVLYHFLQRMPLVQGVQV